MKLMTLAMMAAATMIFTVSGVQAATVTGFKIMDIGSTANNSGVYNPMLDGHSGDFKFASMLYIDTDTFGGTASGSFTGDVGNGTINMGAANPLNSFSTGFMFARQRFLVGTGGVSTADITNGVLSNVNLKWFGQIESYLFHDLGFNNLAPYNAVKIEFIVPGANANEWKVAFQWAHIIEFWEDPTGGSYSNQRTVWRTEGVMTTASDGVIVGNYNAVPVPAAAWLLGSGLIGLASVARKHKAI